MWIPLLTDLKRAGLSDTEVARRVNSAQSTISRLRKGNIKNPTWALGQALIALAEQIKQAGQ